MHLVLSRISPRDVDAIIPIFHKAFQDFDLAHACFGHEGPTSYAYMKRTILSQLQSDAADVYLKIEDHDAEEVDVVLLGDDGMPIGTEKRKRIVCASNWKIFPTYVAPQPQPQPQAKDQEEASGAQEQEADHGLSNGYSGSHETVAATATAGPPSPEDPFFYLESAQERRDAATVLGDFMARRQRMCAEGHVLCFLLYTDPEYQGRGAGRMMMEWGSEVADALMLPVWLEASAHGEFLYRKIGFEEVEKVYLKTESFELRYTMMKRPVKVSQLSLKAGRLVKG